MTRHYLFTNDQATFQRFSKSGPETTFYCVNVTKPEEIPSALLPYVHKFEGQIVELRFLLDGKPMLDNSQAGRIRLRHLIMWLHDRVAQLDVTVAMTKEEVMECSKDIPFETLDYVEVLEQVLITF